MSNPKYIKIQSQRGIITEIREDQLADYQQAGWHVFDESRPEKPKVVQFPSFEDMTKDQLNDYAATYIPDLEVKPAMRKGEMVAAIRAYLQSITKSQEQNNAPQAPDGLE